MASDASRSASSAERDKTHLNSAKLEVEVPVRAEGRVTSERARATYRSKIPFPCKAGRAFRPTRLGMSGAVGPAGRLAPGAGCGSKGD